MFTSALEATIIKTYIEDDKKYTYISICDPKIIHTLNSSCRWNQRDLKRDPIGVAKDS